MIDFGNHYYVAQIWVLSLGTCCPPREHRLLVSCSPVPHHVVPEGPLGGHGSDDVIDDAFDGCPEATWNVD